MEQRLTSARIESRLANLPIRMIYVYDRRDSLTYKPRTLAVPYSTVHSDTHLNSTARDEACRRLGRPQRAALACNNYDSS